MSTSASISETSASASTSEISTSEASASLPMLEPHTSPFIREASTSPFISEQPTSPSTSEAFASLLIHETSTSPSMSDSAFVHETPSSLYSTSPPISSTSISPPLFSPTDSYSPPWTSSASHSRTSSSTSSSWASSSSSSSGSPSTKSASTSFIPAPPPAPPHNYILEITLCPHIIRNPTVSRTVSLPPHTSFATLHAAIQLSFGWTSSHPWRFSIGDDEAVDPDDLPADDPDPDNPDQADTDTDQQEKEHHRGPPLLHLLPPPLYHPSLYPPLPPHTHYAHTLPLSTIYTSPHLGCAPLTHHYDPHHARWTHTVVLVGLAPGPLRAQATPARIVCVAGAGIAPPEACPGPVVWELLKRARRKREGGVSGLVSGEEARWLGWFERVCGGGG